MKEVTKPVTPGLLIRVPDREVLFVKIEGERIDVQFKQTSRIGPFGEDALIESLLTGPRPSERLDLLNQYNYVTSPLAAGALEEFMEIRRPQDAAAFIQKYGPLAGWNDLSMPFQFVAQQREQLSIILWLNKAINDGKKQDIKAALKDAAAMGLDITDDANPSKTIAFHLTKRLVPAIPALLPVDGGLQAVLICPDVMTGLYGLLMSAVAESKPWKPCEKCGRLFRAAERKRFCSKPCQEAAKQQRYRNVIVKSSIQKKGSYGRKHPTAKKRQ